MKIEISAGGIVFRKIDNRCQILVLKDKNGQWTFPKGLIEDRENKKETAAREIAEETGIKNIRLVGELSSIGYWYKWKSDLVKKTVYYFLYRFTGRETPKPQKEEGITQAMWTDLEKAPTIIGYPKTNKPVLEEVLRNLKSERH